MTNLEDEESDEDRAGMEALSREYEPYAERARKSNYGLLHISGGLYAVIERKYCSFTQAHGQRLGLAEFELMKGYEEVDSATACKHLLKLRAEEEDAADESIQDSN